MMTKEELLKATPLSQARYRAAVSEQQKAYGRIESNLALEQQQQEELARQQQLAEEQAAQQPEFDEAKAIEEYKKQEAQKIQDRINEVIAKIEEYKQRKVEAFAREDTGAARRYDNDIDNLQEEKADLYYAQTQGASLSAAKSYASSQQMISRNIYEGTQKYKQQGYNYEAARNLSIAELNKGRSLTESDIKEIAPGGVYKTPSGYMSIETSKLKSPLPSTYKYIAPTGTVIQTPSLDYKKFLTEKGLEIKRYKDAGYSQKEAQALAEYSMQARITPSREIAGQYLRTEAIGQGYVSGLSLKNVEARLTGGVGIAPKGIFTKSEFFMQKGKEKITELIPTSIELKPAEFKPILGEKKSMIPQQWYGKTTVGAVGAELVDIGSWMNPYTGVPRAVSYVGSVGERTIMKYPSQQVKPIEYVMAGLIVAGGVYAGAKYLNAPKIKEITIRKPTTHTAFDVIKPIQTEQGMFEQGGFILKTKVPQQEIIITTRLREFIGMKPIEKIIIPSKLYYSYTPYGMITKQGEVIGNPLVLSKRVGAKYGTMETLQGIQTRITPKEFFNLPTQQQYAYQKIAEIKTGGVPVSLKNVPNILGKDFEYSVGDLSLVKRGRIYPSAPKEQFKFFYPEGKTTTRASISTIAKDITTPKLEELGIKKFKTFTGVKDTTFPLTRATGKIPMIKGTTLILPSKEIETTGGQILKLKVSPKSIQTIKAAEVLVAKQIPKSIFKVPTKLIPKSNIIEKIIPSKTISSIISTTIPVSEYWGTSYGIPISTKQLVETIPQIKMGYNPKENIYLPNKASNVYSLKGATDIFTPSRLSDLSIYSNLQGKKKQEISSINFDFATNLKKSEMMQDTFPTSKETQRIFQGQEELQLIKQMQQVKQLQQIKQLQQLKQLQQVKQVQQIKQPRTPKIPIIPIIPIPKVSKSTKILEKNLFGDLGKGYKVLIKRQGKYKQIGQILPKSEAIRLGEKVARITLARSFRIEPTNVKVRGIEGYYTPSPEVFRTYKIKKGLRIPLKEEWIQKARYSLSSKGEVTEIMKARKQKGGKLKWL